MSKPIIFDGEQHREMTDSEYAQWQIDNVEAQAKAEAQNIKAEARLAVLEKLGLTEDEAAALFS